MHPMQKVMAGRPTDETCENCKARPATDWWSGDATFFEVNHGAPVAAWCAVCCIDAQLERARAQAARIPQLEVERAKLIAAETKE